ncbi:tetratricopeptide repeat protein [Labilibaculum sp.]|uniref:tetratricopeptide repeat-containing sensor histidine kinase n=1 Tax=Labilibaculum sp. TaxID=2060723 RepID=UPI0035632A84
MKKLILLVFILLNFIAIAQTSKIDSLENSLQLHTKKDIARVNLLNDFASEALQIDQTKSIKYAEEAFELACKLRFTKGKAESLYCLGLSNYLSANYQKSLDFFLKSINTYEVLGNQEKKAVCLKYIGIIYEYQGDYTMSLKHYHKALEINEAIGNKQGKANCLHNIGIIYHIQGNYPISLEYYQKSLKINEEEGSKQQIANCLNNIGSIHYEQANYTSALTYYQKSLKISKEIAYKEGEARGLNNIGEIYRIQTNYTLALTYYQKSLKIIEEIGDENGIAMTMNNIGTIYYSQANYALALDFYQKALEKSEKINNQLIILDSYANLGSFYLGTFNFDKALDYTQKSFAIAKELENLSQQKRIYLQISDIYTATKNYKKALENYILYKELSDSTFNEKNIKELSRLEYQYEFEKEKQAIELEQQKKDAITAEKSKHQSVLNIIFILVLALLTSLVLVVLRSFIQKHKANNILIKQKKQIEDTNEELILQKEEIQNFAFELEKANKTKDKFFSIIAHDLKNPFNALLGFSDYLLKNHTTMDEEERGYYLKIINESSMKTFRLLDNLLTWARSQTGKIEFTPELFNISALISETISLLEESAWDKEIKLMLNAEKDLSITADKNMIDTVIRNLVSNAIKFTSKGGVIIVELQTVTDENNQKFAEISVKDNGIGVPHEIQSKLFTITENITTKGTEEETGTGLGLILCKEFVERHNGKIWVESDIDKGSTFVFRIPLFS